MASPALFLRARWAGPRVQGGVLSIPPPTVLARTERGPGTHTHPYTQHTHRTERLEGRKKARALGPDKGRAAARGAEWLHGGGGGVGVGLELASPAPGRRLGSLQEIRGLGRGRSPGHWGRGINGRGGGVVRSGVVGRGPRWGADQLRGC